MGLVRMREIQGKVHASQHACAYLFVQALYSCSCSGLAALLACCRAGGSQAGLSSDTHCLSAVRLMQQACLAQACSIKLESSAGAAWI